MPYTVIWDARPQNELARLWTNSPDRQAVADAADLIDRSLRSAPENLGQDFGTFRIFKAPPLTVVFKVFPDDRQVKVLDVWRIP